MVVSSNGNATQALIARIISCVWVLSTKGLAYEGDRCTVYQKVTRHINNIYNGQLKSAQFRSPGGCRLQRCNRQSTGGAGMDWGRARREGGEVLAELRGPLSNVPLRSRALTGGRLHVRGARGRVPSLSFAGLLPDTSSLGICMVWQARAGLVYAPFCHLARSHTRPLLPFVCFRPCTRSMAAWCGGEAVASSQ